MRGIIKFLIIFFIILAAAAAVTYHYKTPEEPVSKYIDPSSAYFIDGSNVNFAGGKEWCTLEPLPQDYEIKGYAESLAPAPNAIRMLVKGECTFSKDKPQVLLLAIPAKAAEICKNTGSKTLKYNSMGGEVIYCPEKNSNMKFGLAMKFIFPASEGKSLMVIVDGKTFKENRKYLMQVFKSFSYSIK